MDTRGLLRMTITLALGALPALAFGQAAAESALTNANSAAATAKAGSVLGRALNQSGRQLAGRIQEQTSKPLQLGTQPNRRQLKLKSQARAGTVRTDSVPGNVVSSIRGAAVTCEPTDLKTQAPGDKTSTESRQTNCPNKALSLQPGPQDKDKEKASDKYKSVITLSFPK
jgi:hypothetical protein